MADASTATGVLQYRRRFNPEPLTQVSPSSTYVWNEDVILAVNVALVTERALLIRGEPGIGKTSVAEAAAAALGWRFYRHTVTSRTEARDILWRFDAVRRLADAQARRELDDYHYIEPRELWWALNREEALRRGRPADSQEPPALEPLADVNATRSPTGAVVLLDEIDKADPAVANDLLETFSAYRFRVDSVAQPFEVTRATHSAGSEPSGLLIVVTTNEERDLPEAFLRRCIVHHMQWPSDTSLPAYADFRTLVQQIAQAHWPHFAAELWGDAAVGVVGALLDRIEEERQQAQTEERRPPGLAELLDALRTTQTFGITVDDTVWSHIARLVWRKAPENAGA